MKNVMLEPAARQGKPIVPASPYRKKSAVVSDQTMSYVDVGRGTPVVFLHGDIMSSFLWHNVIPHVSDGFRAIAVDLIGAGDSSKLPVSGEGAYSFDLHAHYLGALLDTLDLGDDVFLVGHDWGANLAFDWAIKNENRVRGLAFAEALLPPFEWADWPLLVREPFRYMRSPEGGRDVLDNNYFLHAARDNMMRILAPEEWDEIVRPYANPGEDRCPTLDWPRMVPFGDDSTPVRGMQRLRAQYHYRLQAGYSGLYMVPWNRRRYKLPFPTAWHRYSALAITSNRRAGASTPAEPHHRHTLAAIRTQTLGALDRMAISRQSTRIPRRHQTAAMKSAIAQALECLIRSGQTIGAQSSTNNSKLIATPR